MVARLEQDAKRRAEKKLAPAGETVEKIDVAIERADRLLSGYEFAREAALRWDKAEDSALEAQGTTLWDEAVESLGRSAGVLQELAESTGEAIARISARGDRIDRIQKETRALLNALVASEADA